MLTAPAQVAAFSVRTFEEELPARSLEHVRRVAKFQNAAFLDEREGVRFEGFAFWIALFAEKQEEEVRPLSWCLVDRLSRCAS